MDKEIENELLEGLNLYTLKELKDIEGSYYAKVKNSNKYIPIKIKNSKNKYLFNKWLLKKDYSIKYLKLEELENYLSKKISVKFE